MPDLPQRLSDWLAGVRRPPIADFIGLRLVSAGSGSSVLEVNVDGRHHNPIGTVHGGIFADLADAAMGTALATLLAEGETFTTNRAGDPLPGSRSGRPVAGAGGRHPARAPGSLCGM